MKLLDDWDVDKQLEADPQKESLEIPDEVSKLYNQIGLQLQLVIYSGKSSSVATCRMVKFAYSFFKENKYLLED